MTIGEQSSPLKFVDGPQGRSVVVNSVWKPDFTDRVKGDRATARLIYSPGRDTKCDLAFLTDLPQIRNFSFGMGKRCDVTALSDCTWIEYLAIGEQPGKPDFSKMTSLRTLGIEGKRQTAAVLAATQLHELLWTKCPLTDLTGLGSFRSLRQLSIVGGALVSTAGLSELHTLEIFGLTNLRKLTEIVGLPGASRLQVLDLAGCAALPPMTDVGALTQLTRLHLSLRGEVPSIEPIANCRRLETLSIENTKIADGRIAFLLDLPALTDPYIAPTKGYDMTNSELRRRVEGRSTEYGDPPHRA